MGKKKNKSIKPWCYYCDREFEDEKVLIQHQRAKHYKCDNCHKKFNTIGGLVTHSLQVHKENITSVPNALEGKDSVELEIYGLEGIPEEAQYKREEEILGVKRQKLEPKESNNPSIAPQGTIMPQSLPPVMMMPHQVPMMYPGYGAAPHHMYPGQALNPMGMMHGGMIPQQSMWPQNPNGRPLFPVQTSPMPPVMTPIQPTMTNVPLGGSFPVPIPGPVPPMYRGMVPVPPPAVVQSPISINLGGPSPNSSSTNSPQVAGAQQQQQQQQNQGPNQTPQSQTPAVRIVFNPNTEESMEERRASLGKYQVNGNKKEIDLNRLDQKIQSRLESMSSLIARS